MAYHHEHSPLHATRYRGRGLTLVEVLAVVIILGLIAATLTMSFRGQMATAKRQLAKTGIGVIVNAIETFSLENGRLPTMEEGLGVLTVPGPGRADAYLKADKLMDPWRSPYIYIAPGPKGSYAVISYGADKQPGGAAGNDAEDISSDDLAERSPGTNSPGGTP